MSFENSTIESLATSLAKTRPKVLKREAQVVFDSRNDEPDKKQKLGDGSPFTTTPSTGSEAPLTDLQRSFQNPLIEWEEGKSTSSSAEQQKKQGRTRAKPVQTFQPAKPYTYIGIPKFRRDRPVETNIPYEVWKVILSFCPPAFLEKVARVSDPTLHDVLMRHGGDSEKVWKLARLREYGPDHPDPPPDITERKYADLLTGVGCQYCDDKMARRTYWAYQRRLCVKCHTARTIIHKDVNQEYLSRLPAISTTVELSECIPAASYDSWHHYQWVGTYEDVIPAWVAKEPTTRYVMYSQKAYSKFKNELSVFLSGNPTTAGVEQWLESKKEANSKRVGKLQAIEDWYGNIRMDKAAKAAALKKRRADYFTERAALMDPPIDAETLQQCASYKTAVASPHEPTQRSWVILRPKLEEERLAIEANRYGRKLWENVEPMIKRRALNDSSEQRCVLSLADAVIEQVMNSPVTVANEDLVLLILQRVYDAYQECGEKPAGMFGEHRLIMDDARMIYYTKIVPRLARLSRRGRSMEDATMFRCPGCPESIDIVNTDDDDSDEENTRILPRYRSFASHYKHILTKHSHEEDFSCFLPYRVTVVPGYKRTLWMCLEWPQRLPILASHEISDGHWDPQEELEFENIPHNGVSIDGPAPSEFIPSLFYAAIKLQDVDIDSKTRAAMIIHFAGARWEFSAIKEEGITRNVPEYYLKHMREALRFCKKHCDIEGLFDGFLCGQCHAAPGPHGYKFEDLSTHYLECHDMKVWAKRMFDFNGIESLPTLQKRLGDPADNPTARALLELFPRLT